MTDKVKVIAAKDFNANGTFYLVGEEIKDLSFEQVLKLIELGFTKPLDTKELVLLKRQLKKNKEEL